MNWQQLLFESGNCPYCGGHMEEEEVHNSLSRWLDGKYICNLCGEFEAWVDLYRSLSPLAFTATLEMVGVAIEGKSGYIPLAGSRARLIPYEDGKHIARILNDSLRDPVGEREELRIVSSSMRSNIFMK